MMSLSAQELARAARRKSTKVVLSWSGFFVQRRAKQCTRPQMGNGYVEIASPVPPEHLQAYAFSGDDERVRDERFKRVLERHSALLRELVFANEMAAAIPSRTGDFAMAAVWKKATAGPPGAPQPPLSAETKKLF